MRIVEVNAPEHLRLRDHDASSVGLKKPVLLGLPCQRLDDEVDHASVAAVRPCARNSRALSVPQGRILAFAKRILPRTVDLLMQSSLDQRQRFQQLFFPEGVTFDGHGFVGSAATAPAFNYL